MKTSIVVTLTGILFYACGSTKALVTTNKTPIRTSLDLKNVVDDKVMVTVDPGVFRTDDVFFYIPKTVPGTYSTDNYGQYIDDFIC